MNQNPDLFTNQVSHWSLDVVEHDGQTPLCVRRSEEEGRVSARLLQLFSGHRGGKDITLAVRCLEVLRPINGVLRTANRPYITSY